MKQALFKNPILARVTAVVCTLLWGTAFPFIKLGYQAFNISDSGSVGAKLLFAGLRFSLAGLMVLLFWALQKKKTLPIKSELSMIALLGLVQTFSQYLFTYIGIGFTGGANTSVITACASFLTVLAVPFFFKSDRLTWLKIAGCIVGFVGVLAVNRGGGVTSETLFGDSMIFMSTVCAAAGNVIAKKAALKLNAVKLTAYQLLTGGLLLIIVGLCCGGTIGFSLNGVLILLWLALVSAVAFALWTTLLQYHPASKISIFNLLVPVFGTLLSGVLLGEDVFRIETLISLVLIALGIILVNISRSGKHD